MTESEAIRAGTLVVTRKAVRKLHAANACLSLSTIAAHGVPAVTLQSTESKAVLNALDLHLSNELGKLGVGETVEPKEAV